MTTWAIVAVVIALGASLAGRSRARSRSRVHHAPDEPVDLDLRLDVRLDAVFAETVEHRDGLIASRLDQVVTRRVPVRRLEAVPDLHAVRLCFADGTRLFGKGAKPGDLGVLSMLLTRHHIWPTSARRDGAGNHLLLHVEGRRDAVDVVITGLDQPD